MARRVVLTLTLAAASVNGIAISQTIGAAGNLTINGAAASGGVATLDTQRRVLITSAGNDSGINFTVYGTNQSGAAISETVTGANIGAVATRQDFLTVTRVATSGAAAAGVQIGTNGVGSTPWQMFNAQITPDEIGFGIGVTGTVNCSVEYTYDAFLAPIAIYKPPVVPIPTPIAHSVLNSITANSDGTIDWPIHAWRLTMNSGTGTAKLTGIQAGIRN